MLNRREFMQTTTGATAVLPATLSGLILTEEEPIKVHRRSFLTDNILLENDGKLELNIYGRYYELHWDFTVTKGTQYLGMFNIRGPQKTLIEYGDDKKTGEIEHRMLLVAEYIVKKKLWRQPNAICTFLEWDMELA